jgi:hypothetical protein
MAGRSLVPKRPTPRRRNRTATGRVRQSTKALAQFWLTPPTTEQPSLPPFCPSDPTEEELEMMLALGKWGRSN